MDKVTLRSCVGSCLKSQAAQLEFGLRILELKFKEVLYNISGNEERSWLRHCRTTRKVADSIPDDVTGISH